MPIRFRCVYCDKLLGIARRKAGVVVNCPHCGEKLIVPTPEESAIDKEAPPQLPKKETKEQALLAPTNSEPLFERSDFEALLQPEPTFRTGEPEEEAKGAKPKKGSSRASRSFDEFDVEEVAAQPTPIPLDEAPQRFRTAEGIFISRSRATWMSVLAVFMLLGTFALGVVVGKMLR